MGRQKRGKHSDKCTVRSHKWVDGVLETIDEAFNSMDEAMEHAKRTIKGGVIQTVKVYDFFGGLFHTHHCHKHDHDNHPPYA